MLSDEILEEDDDGELKTVEGRKKAGETLDTAAWLINSESATPASQVHTLNPKLETPEPL